MELRDADYNDQCEKGSEREKRRETKSKKRRVTRTVNYINFFESFRVMILEQSDQTCYDVDG